MLGGMLRMDMPPAPTSYRQPVPNQSVDVSLRHGIRGAFAKFVDVRVAVGLSA